MWRRGSRYWTRPQARDRPPIYTLRFPWIRLYVVDSTTLIPSVQKQVKTISFEPVMVRMAARIMGSGKGAMNIISRGLLEDDGHLAGVAKVIHATLLPGAKLDALSRRSTHFVKVSMDALESRINEPGAGGHTTLHLYQWVTHQVMMATTEGIYGPQNPFRDESVVRAFRQVMVMFLEFESGILPLMISPIPSITAKRSIKARETLLEAYISYYEKRGYEDPEASAFIRDRQRYFSSEGLSLEDIAAAEVLTSIALLGNTMPASFWLIYHIVSNPRALADCLEELTKTLNIPVEGDGKGTVDTVRSIDIDSIRHHCPVLLSTFKEVFRYHGVGISSRVIMEDHMLEGGFLLKKNNILLIPGVVQHQARSVWGDNVDVFSYKRFVSGPSGNKGSRRLRAVAFRGFGGGSTLCPGRHFAATEIMALAAMFILRFDSRPASGAGWAMPSVEKDLGTSIHQPDNDVEVDVRLVGERARWEVRLSESDTVMEVSAEDMASIDLINLT